MARGTQHHFSTDARSGRAVESLWGLLPELDPLKPRLAHLSVFGIASRYPGVRADQQAGEEAVTTAEEVRTVVRAKFGLP